MSKGVNDMQRTDVSQALTEQFTQLMQSAYDDILRFCFMTLGDRMMAEDAAQEVFIKAYRHIHTLRETAYAKTWLTSIAINTCRDIRRSAWLRHTDRSVSLEDLPPASCEFTPQDDSIVREIMQLPQKYREVILLHYYQDMSAAQCAQALRISSSGFYRRLKKAQALLKSKLERWVFDA